MTTDLVRELEARGLLYQATESGLPDALAKGPLVGYIGFDPTAPSLHVGSLLPVLALVRLQRAGHRPIAVVGGGTGLIGDPSGKEAERSLLDMATLHRNVEGIRAQLERFLDFDGPRGAIVVNNAEWLGKLGLLDFLRDVGKHFSVGAMIDRDSVKTRLETREQGISFTEFSYMLLQAYDYLALFDAYGCTLQMGGSDQWGNIISGCDLIRRKRGAQVHGLTFPLVTRADGRKFGKSEMGNIWLDGSLSSPFELYQFWRNTSDSDVVRYLELFTFLSLDEIRQLQRELSQAPERRVAQRTLAAEVTRIVHGAAVLSEVEQASAVLFSDGDLGELTAEQVRGAFATTPSLTIPRTRLEAGQVTLAALLAETGLSPSKGKARQAIEDGAILLNHKRVTDPERVLGAFDLLAGGVVVLRRGKKTYHVVRVEGDGEAGAGEPPGRTAE